MDHIQRIQLTTDEDETITVRPLRRKEILEEYSLSLIGKFLTTKPINIRVAKNLLRSMWKMGEDLKMVELDDGLLQFKFSMECQLNWVWNNGPWCFDNQILVLRRWEKGMTARSVTFTHMPIWVQVWGLPFDLITEEAAHDIGQGLGKVIEVDCKALKTDQARFLRIKVEVPLEKPLRRGGPVVSPEGDEARVAFRYERLVGWCFACGRVGHDVKECRSASEEDRKVKPYGEWLKAGTRGRPNTPRSNQKIPDQRRREPEAATPPRHPEAGTPPPHTPAVPPETLNAATEKPKNPESVLPNPTNTFQTLMPTIAPISSPDTLQNLKPTITPPPSSNTLPSDQGFMTGNNPPNQSPTSMVSKNLGEELYYVPIIYGGNKDTNTCLTVVPCAHGVDPHVKTIATWKKNPKAKTKHQ